MIKVIYTTAVGFGTISQRLRRKVGLRAWPTRAMHLPQWIISKAVTRPMTLTELNWSSWQNPANRAFWQQVVVRSKMGYQCHKDMIMKFKSGLFYCISAEVEISTQQKIVTYHNSYIIYHKKSHIYFYIFFYMFLKYILHYVYQTCFLYIGSQPQKQFMIANYSWQLL